MKMTALKHGERKEQDKKAGTNTMCLEKECKDYMLSFKENSISKVHFFVTISVIKLRQQHWFFLLLCALIKNYKAKNEDLKNIQKSYWLLEMTFPCINSFFLVFVHRPVSCIVHI